MLPSDTPRPPEELEQLKCIWKSPEGFRIVTDVNNTVVGLLLPHSTTRASCGATRPRRESSRCSSRTASHAWPAPERADAAP